MDDTATAGSSIPIEETPIIDPTSGNVTSHPVSVSEPQVVGDVVPPKPESGPEPVVSEAAQIFAQAPPHDDTLIPNNPPRKNHIGTIIFIVILFGLGIWLSTQLRSFFAPATSQEVIVPTSAPSKIATSEQATTSATVDSSWVTYQAAGGVSFKLPASVATPVCDGGSCPSKGTTLPGSSRFTVAARGKGQLLPDFRGAILTDATGKEFTMKQTTIGGVSVYEYVGNFTGRTGGGYTFTAMRGVLVPVNDTLSIEFNHFAPLGITSDFAKDDALFENIVGTFTSTSSAQARTK